MFFFIIIFIKSDKSLFFAPGFSSSELYATITQPENFPKCEGEYNHRSLLQNVTKDCQESILDVVYDKTTGELKHPDGVIIETDPIKKSDFKMEKFLQGHDNSYVVPYDWTLYFPGTQKVFSELKSAIEQNYSATNEKVILAGYSMGTNFMRYFTTEYNDIEWTQKYVDGVLFIAPGIAGTFTSIIFVATEKVFMLSGPAALHMPSQWAMFPSFPLYKKCVQDGDTFIDCENVYDEMKKNGYSDDVTDAVYNSVKSYLSKNVTSPGVRTGFIMNSGLEGTCGVKKDDDGKFVEVHCPADGSLETRGAKFACSNWDDVQCYDFEENDEAYNHQGIGGQPYTNELVLKFIRNEPFNKKSWFSGAVMYAVIGGAAAVVVIVVVVAVVCVVKKKKKSNESLQQSLIINQ